MIVVDTNILVHFWMPTDQSELCEAVFKKDSEWVAPLLWRSEFRNVIFLYLRNQIIDLASAYTVMEKVEAQMREREFRVKSLSVISQALISDCSAYDCEFIALANELGIKLITFDKKILRHYSQIGISPQEFIG